MPTWVLERDVFSEECFGRMVEHFKVNAIPYHVVRIIPFIHEVEGKTPKIEGPVVVYGSIGIQKLAKVQGWTPGVWTNDDFSNSACANALGDLCVNPDGKVMKLSEAEAFMTGRGTEEFFIKPDGDAKEFAGTVMRADEIAGWMKQMIEIGYLENGEFDVFVGEPKKLGCEWRAVVVDGEIASCSIYRQYGMVKPELHILPEVREAIMAAAAKFTPAPVYVIDIAQVGDEFKVIEYNTFNSAGLYACDVAPIIDRINRLVG